VTNLIIQIYSIFKMDQYCNTWVFCSNFFLYENGKHLYLLDTHFYMHQRPLDY